MTEQEWEDCAGLTRMLVFLKGKVSDRKWRLFACGCWRFAWHLLTDEPFRLSVEVAERFSDGKATSEELFAAWQDGSAAATTSAWHAASSTSCRLSGSAAAAVQGDRIGGPAQAAAQASETKKHAELLRHIIGPLLFRPVAFDPACLTRTVQALAQATYENRNLPSGTLDNDRLVVLADALEDAGCGNAEILDHLRQPGDHVRGCWCVDLILGKE